MKKKHRNITVNGKEYAWNVHNNVDGDGGNLVKIWYNKKVIFNDIYGGHHNITPKFISEAIKIITE